MAAVFKDGVHWLQHCLCWFGFSEPAKFVPHRDGGYFASVATGKPLLSFLQNGLRKPPAETKNPP